MNKNTSYSGKTKSQRYLFFDLLRGWALLVMFEAHVFNAFLNPVYKGEWWFQILNFLNGLVAPAFLFVSGAVFYISTYGKTDELRTFGISFRRKVYKIILLFLAGYSLHLPFLSLKRMLNDADAESLSHFYSVDVLQCIAAGLLFILLLKLIIKSERVFLFTTVILFFIITLFSFIVWSTDPVRVMPLYIASYFTPKYGSLFPVLPWFSFLLGGVLFANYFMRFKGTNKEESLIKYSLIIGASMGILGFILLTDIFLPASIRMIRPNPIFILQRFGIILASLSLCWYFFNFRGEKKSFVTEVGKESLLIYWLHLQIIFRRMFDNQSIDTIINKSFNGIESTAAWAVLTILMILAAVSWSRLKSKYPLLTTNVARLIIWTTILVFFFS